MQQECSTGLSPRGEGLPKQSRLYLDFMAELERRPDPRHQGAMVRMMGMGRLGAAAIDTVLASSRREDILANTYALGELGNPLAVDRLSAVPRSHPGRALNTTYTPDKEVCRLAADALRKITGVRFGSTYDSWMKFRRSKRRDGG